MFFATSRAISWAAVASGVMALVVRTAGAPVQAVQAAPPAPPPSHWLSTDTKAHMAALTLIAGYTNALEGFNFDGYGKGTMIVSISSGYRVTIVYQNRGEYPHSVLVTPYAKKDLREGWPIAFRRAVSTDPANGAAQGATQRFSFVADKVGAYAIICAVSGHEQFGMWDVLRVTRGGTPTVAVYKGRSRG